MPNSSVPSLSDILACAGPSWDKWSVVYTRPLKLGYGYLNRDMAYAHYNAARSHAVPCSLVWHGQILAQH